MEQTWVSDSCNDYLVINYPLPWPEEPTPQQREQMTEEEIRSMQLEKSCRISQSPYEFQLIRDRCVSSDWDLHILGIDPGAAGLAYAVILAKTGNEIQNPNFAKEGQIVECGVINVLGMNNLTYKGVDKNFFAEQIGLWMHTYYDSHLNVSYRFVGNWLEEQNYKCPLMVGTQMAIISAINMLQNMIIRALFAKAEDASSDPGNAPLSIEVHNARNVKCRVVRPRAWRFALGVEPEPKGKKISKNGIAFLNQEDPELCLLLLRRLSEKEVGDIADAFGVARYGWMSWKMQNSNVPLKKRKRSSSQS